MSLTENKIKKQTLLDGATYVSLVASGANAINNKKAQINELNVFPVPDGDTGSNMSMTVSPIRGDMSSAIGNLSESADKVASLCLRSARGNSGVILSLFFRGIAKGLKGKETADGEDFLAALSRGVEEAYKAVQRPTEGTILTVMRCSVEEAISLFPSSDKTLGGLFECLYDAACDTLKKTPEMLPVLKQANVVDAGGAGFVAILDGMRLALAGHPVEGVADQGETSAKADFAQFETANIENPYCTECIITKSREYMGEGKVGAFRNFVLSAGDSAVFVDDSEIVKVHVHTKDPGKVLSEALKYGSLYTVKVENMQNQHTELVSAEEKEKGLVAAPEKKYGFVAVTPGEGIKSVFSDLGVDSFVFGGQTMNPSTEQLLSAVNSTPAENVYLLPNNSNICLVATQCANLCKDKNVIVIPTVSVPQGVAAMLSFDADLSADENTVAMEEAASAVTTLEMTFAARDSEFDGNSIKEGQILGLVNHKVKYVSDDKVGCLEKLSEHMSDASFITLFYGEDVTEDEANAAVAYLEEKLGDDVEISAINGGQPLYYYTISVE